LNIFFILKEALFMDKKEKMLKLAESNQKLEAINEKLVALKSAGVKPEEEEDGEPEASPVEVALKDISDRMGVIEDKLNIVPESKGLQGADNTKEEEVALKSKTPDPKKNLMKMTGRDFQGRKIRTKK
jgi:hypothetical protein